MYTNRIEGNTVREGCIPRSSDGKANAQELSRLKEAQSSTRETLASGDFADPGNGIRARSDSPESQPPEFKLDDIDELFDQLTQKVADEVMCDDLGTKGFTIEALKKMGLGVANFSTELRDTLVGPDAEFVSYENTQTQRMLDRCAFFYSFLLSLDTKLKKMCFDQERTCTITYNPEAENILSFEVTASPLNNLTPTLFDPNSGDIISNEFTSHYSLFEYSNMNLHAAINHSAERIASALYPGVDYMNDDMVMARYRFGKSLAFHKGVDVIPLREKLLILAQIFARPEDWMLNT